MDAAALQQLEAVCQQFYEGRWGTTACSSRDKPASDVAARLPHRPHHRDTAASH